ncbi:class I SAM-dependent methyltransferase [Neobacillus drentensis]|uniref:class I SAM-dependent methyltransferase n=1 Tax=Neobacillus drentensis TaxID=220684 RepID=UPI002FFDAE45
MGGFTYFDFLAKFGVGGAHPGGIPLTQKVLASENITNKSRILDAGCGTGQTAAYLYQHYFAKVVGLDINPIMIEKAKIRFQSLNIPIKLIQGSIEKLPFKDNTFDFILSESVLAFVNKPAALGEFFRVLKKGGRLIANEMTINAKLSPVEESEIIHFYALDSLLLEDDWRNLFHEAGFQEIVIKANQTDLGVGNTTTEFNFSANFEPELFQVLNEHGNLVLKYQDILSHRVITCSKL